VLDGLRVILEQIKAYRGKANAYRNKDAPVKGPQAFFTFYSLEEHIQNIRYF
jgi:hypothetical protein